MHVVLAFSPVGDAFRTRTGPSMPAGLPVKSPKSRNNAPPVPPTATKPPRSSNVSILGELLHHRLVRGMACGGSLQRRQTADDPGGPEATQSGRLGCDMDTTCALKKNEKDYLSYSDYFRLLVHVTCCKETATLPLWIRLMIFSAIVKVTILVARPSGAPNLSHTGYRAVA